MLPKNGRRGMVLRGKSKVSVSLRTKGHRSFWQGQVIRFKDLSGHFGVVPKHPHENVQKL